MDNENNEQNTSQYQNTQPNAFQMSQPQYQNTQPNTSQMSQPQYQNTQPNASQMSQPQYQNTQPNAFQMSQPQYQNTQPNAFQMSQPQYQNTQPNTSQMSQPQYQNTQLNTSQYQNPQPNAFQMSQPQYQNTQPNAFQMSQPQYQNTQPNAFQMSQPQYQNTQPNTSQMSQPQYQNTQPNTSQMSQPQYQNTQPNTFQMSQPHTSHWSQPQTPTIVIPSSPMWEVNELQRVGINFIDQHNQKWKPPEQVVSLELLEIEVDPLTGNYCVKESLDLTSAEFLKPKAPALTIRYKTGVKYDGKKKRVLRINNCYYTSPFFLISPKQNQLDPSRNPNLNQTDENGQNQIVILFFLDTTRENCPKSISKDCKNFSL